MCKLLPLAANGNGHGLATTVKREGEGAVVEPWSPPYGNSVMLSHILFALF